MKKITTVLFDFDGVITNTEKQYDDLFDKLNIQYNWNIPDLAKRLKGTQLTELAKNFPEFTEEQRDIITKQTFLFEMNDMTFPPVKGVLDFIDYVKNNGYKIGLATSSPDTKMKKALRELKLENTFDTVVTSDRIEKGKPDPSCYLTAAKDLNSNPDECIVFEDSWVGMEAATRAGMKLVGVATTLDKNKMKEKTPDVIEDFSDIEELKTFLN